MGRKSSDIKEYLEQASFWEAVFAILEAKACDIRFFVDVTQTKQILRDTHFAFFAVIPTHNLGVCCVVVDKILTTTSENCGNV